MNTTINILKKYKSAYPDGRDGIATATRLLAMKRPDYFVCVDNKNLSGLSEAFGVTATSLKAYDGYWEGIIERVLESNWWSSDTPIDALEQNVWKSRTAFLDAIFYDSHEN